MGIFRKNKRKSAFCSKRTVFCALFLFAIFGASLITSLILNTNAEGVPVRTVEFFSEHTNYENSDPGAWKVIKSAEWADTGKARITFEVNSIRKHDENRKYDILLVVDSSGSMAGDKITRIKADTTNFINSLLSDTDNRIALISFQDTATVLSEFTNEKNIILNLINNISAAGTANYYDGFIKSKEILENYIHQDNRELMLLFLTGSYPNINTPNEVAEYQTIKSNYPYITINGVQYGMSETALRPITSISDHQFIANINSPNNILFEAANSPYIYSQFTITDYVDSTYWTIADTEAIMVSLGNANLEYDNSTPTIIWNMDNQYHSGDIATLTVNINLKNEYINQESLLLPTSIRETIETSIAENPAENINSPNTPKLSGVHYVTYIANPPNGCEISNSAPNNANHYVFSEVEISDTRLSCPGYIFKGWKIATPGVTKINDDYFHMPDKDVEIIATWGKPDISKTMEGTVHTVTQFLCTKRYALQNADGTYPDYIVDDTELVEYGQTCSYTKSVTDYQTQSTSGVVTENNLTLDLQLPRNTYTLTILKNNSYIRTVTGAGSHRWGESVGISATTTANGAFTTWSQTTGTTSTFDDASSASTIFIMPKSDATIYADGKDGRIYMQDFTLAQCQANCSSGDCTVYDRRDGNDYTIRYINRDCWMTQNLHITGTIKSTDSNFSSPSNFDVSKYSLANTTYCTGSGASASSPKGYGNVCSTHSSGNSNTGNKPTAWYNYAAATAGSITGYSNTTTANNDICPKGWKIPSYSQLSNIRSYSNEFKPVAGGWYNNGSLRDRTTIGFWWSANSINETMRRRLSFDNPALVADYRQRSDGGYIRCVMK